MRIVLIALLISGVINVFFQIMSLKAGYEVDALQKRLEMLCNERQNLLLELGELISMDKVRQYAKMNEFTFAKEVVLINLSKDDMRAEAFKRMR